MPTYRPFVAVFGVPRMTVKIEDYFLRATCPKMKASRQHETPSVIDTKPSSKPTRPGRGFEFARCYYAVKAKPAVEIID